MEFVILDLEWNGAYSNKRKGFINEIIEFGAVKTDSELNILDNFCMVIKPQVGKKLNKRVLQLTRISHEELATGSTFLHVTKKFSQWLGNDTDIILMTWGTGDLLTLIENYRYFSKKGNIPFLKRYVDLQAYIQTRLQLPANRQLGLLTALELLDISMDYDSHHRALDDSCMALNCLRAGWSRPEMLASVQTADREFYRKLTFKTHILSDLTDPLVDQSQMGFDCDICGQNAKQKTDWELRHKIFYAEFYCPRCGRDFCGKIQFRLKYEGPHIWKRIAEIETNAPDVSGQKK